MFRNINEAYQAGRREVEENLFILESVMGTDETLPGSDDELDDVTDVDSVPEDVYAALDKELDRIVSDPKYDDSEIGEMIADDFDEDGLIGEVLTVVDEAADSWLAQINANIDNIERTATETGNVAVSEAVDRYRAVLNGGSTVARNEHTSNFGLSETTKDFQDFNDKKYTSEIGKPYEPVETPKDSTDETKLEGEALRENTDNTDFGLSEDVKIKIKVDKGCHGHGDGDDKEHHGDDDDDDGEEDGETVVNESVVNRYRAILTESKNPDVEDFPGSEGTKTAEGNASVPGMKHTDCSCIGGCGDNSDAEAKEVKVDDGGTDAIDVIKNKYQKALTEANSGSGNSGSGNGQSGQSNSNDDKDKKKVLLALIPAVAAATAAGAKAGVSEAKRRAAAKKAEDDASNGNIMNKIDKLIKAEKDAKSKKDKKGAVSESAEPGKGASEGETTKSSEVEDFPKISDKERGEDCPGRFPAKNYDTDAGDFKSSVDGAKGDDIGGNENVTDAEAKEVKVDDGGTDAIDTIKNKYQKVLAESKNPDVEDFPGSEGTKTAEGNASVPGMEHCDGHCIGGEGDASAMEQKEVKVDDGGTDAIDVIKTKYQKTLVEAAAKNATISRYRAILEAAKKVKKHVCKCGAEMVCDEDGEYYCPECEKDE